MHMHTHRIEIFIFPPNVYGCFVNCKEYKINENNIMMALDVTFFKKKEK